jgi:hypothetical protein
MINIFQLNACNTLESLFRNKSSNNHRIGKNGVTASSFSGLNDERDLRHYRSPVNIKSPAPEQWFGTKDNSTPSNHPTLNVDQSTTGKNYIKAILDTLPANCGDFNKRTLQSILKRPEGGGYAYKSDKKKGIVAQANNIPIYAGNTKIYTPHSTNGPSYCGGESYGVLMDTFNSIKPDLFTNMRSKQIDQFRPSKASDGKNFAKGFYGLWNDNYNGARSSIVNFDLGQSVTNLESACPGDYVKISRKNGYGHSFVFLGYKEGGKKFCYWGSNQSTNGRSVRCEKVSDVTQWSIARVTTPENISKIPDYDGSNIHDNADLAIAEEKQKEEYIDTPLYVDQSEAAKIGDAAHI